MAKTMEIRRVEVAGKPLTCPTCSKDLFWNRRTLMNTTGMTLMGFDWANKEAENEVCANCGYVFWFLR